MTSRRQERVSELLQEELSILIADLADERLQDALVNVTHVSVSPDLRNARVYIEHALPRDQTRRIIEALYHAESFLRKSLLANVTLRYMPHFSFHVDETTTTGQRVDEILERIAQEESHESSEAE